MVQEIGIYPVYAASSQVVDPSDDSNVLGADRVGDGTLETRLGQGFKNLVGCPRGCPNRQIQSDFISRTGSIRIADIYGSFFGEPGKLFPDSVNYDYIDLQAAQYGNI